MTKKNSTYTNQAKRLSVQISLTGLSFLVTSPEGDILSFSEKYFKTIHTPEELLFELTQSLKQEESLQEQFEHVKLIYTTNNYSLVPTSLFDDTKASEYLKFNTKILRNDYISHDEISSYGITVVYVPFMNINNFIFGKYGTFKYYHSTTILLKTLLDSQKNTIGSKVYLHLSKNQFDCIVIKNGKLQLCNTYSFKTPEDFMYYVLFCMEQLGLNPETAETIVCGDITMEDSNYEMLYTYVRNVSFMSHSFPKIAEEATHEQLVLKANL